MAKRKLAPTEKLLPIKQQIQGLPTPKRQKVKADPEPIYEEEEQDEQEEEAESQDFIDAYMDGGENEDEDEEGDDQDDNVEDANEDEEVRNLSNNLLLVRSKVACKLRSWGMRPRCISFSKRTQLKSAAVIDASELKL